MDTHTATSTIVLDPATLSKALTRLGQTIGSDSWTAMTYESSGRGALQRRFLDWYGQYRYAVEGLSGLETEASTSAGILNKFLVENGFAPLFREISDGGVGVAAILDMLVRWAVEARITTIARYDASRYEHRAFEIPKAGAEFFNVPGEEQPLVRLATKDGGGVWLMMTSGPTDGMWLVEAAAFAMANYRPADDKWWSSVQVPTLEIDTEVSLDWMLGLSAGDHIIDQAFQIFKLRMNEEGARVKVATGLATMRGGPRLPKPLVFNRPFIGWFTQPGSSIPMAVFYAHHDSWQAPGGDLEDL